MASTRSTSFERSLDQFRRELSDDQKKDFSGANQKYIISMLQDMQSKLGREKGLCRLTRIEKFLGAMKHIEALVTIFLNVSEVVAFVWGPIKLALMVATTWTDSVRQLIDAYEEIGEALGNLPFFHNLIKSSEHLREVTEDYFADILCFHRCVLDVFSRPDWKAFFKWAWGSFRRRVKPIIESLKRRQDMLSDEKLQSHAIFKEVQDSRSYARDQFRDLQAGLQDIRTAFASEQLRSIAFQYRETKASLEVKLGVPGFRSDSQLESPEQSVGSSGSWVFSHPAFRTWETAESTQDSILFLNGSPGAGKSTLARTIVRHLKDKQSHKPRSLSCLAYFFFKHDDEDRRSTRSMLCHIIAQLINADETIMRLAYEKLSGMDQIELSVLEVLAQDCLTAHRDIYLILDGLDEATDNEAEQSLRWCLNQLLLAASSRGCRLKLLISGQRDGRLDSVLSEQPQVRLDTTDSHQHDIKEYSRSKAAEISARFSLTQQEEQDMLTKITNASQGMFLYAKVVLSNLISMDSVVEFEDEMQNDKFPDNLEQAYDRIVQRVLNQAGPSRQKTVRKILGWVICSKRPLRWREIQSMFCINAVKGTCNARSRRVDSCKKICSSLVDITACNSFRDMESEQIINMVHETASKYLVHNGTINLLHEHANMALFCCRYLSSWPFLEERESDSFHDVLRSGYFGFLDYAAAHYFFHAQQSKSLLEPKVVVGLLDAHRVEASNQLSSSFWMDTFFTKSRNKLELAIQNCVSTIREVVECRQEDFPADDTFLNFCGRIRFKCPKIHCNMFATGFLEQNYRDKHLDFHERPFRCSYTDCFAHTTGYGSQERLQAHNKAIHPTNSDLGAIFPSITGKKKWDIFEACKTGNLSEVKRFYLTGNEIKKQTQRSPFTPFVVAARAGHGNVCKFFVDQGTNPYEGERYGDLDWSPMAESIRQQNPQIIELFLHSGFDFEGEDGRLQFARLIALAILCDNRDGLEQLLEIKSSPEHAEMIREIAEALIHLCKRSNSITGIKRGHTIDATLMRLWFRRAFPHLTHEAETRSRAGSFIKCPDSPEYRACRALLFGNTGFLHQAFEIKCHPLSAFLMDLVNKDDLQVTYIRGCTPLHYLATANCHGDANSCEACAIMTKRIFQIDGGASGNSADERGMLPIHRSLARYVPKPSIYRVLLSQTRNLNHKDNDGESLLHAATLHIHYVRLLLENDGVDLFIRNGKGQTAFSTAVICAYPGYPEVLEALTEANRALAWTADDSEHRLTPLHHALNRLVDEPSYHKSYYAALRFLLSLPEVEQVLCAYTASSSRNYPEKVREFARQQNLDEALRVMDRIGFGM